MAILTDVATAAIDYATRGLRVVPLMDRGKRPRIREWQRKATSDVDQIRQWFEQWPEANVGVAMGPGSDVVDVEYDCDDGQATASELLTDIATPTYTSARSTHRLFRFPSHLQLPSEAVCHFRGLEIRLGTGDKGAQSAMPPSVHETGIRYRWADGLSLADCDVAPFPGRLAKLWLRNTGGDDKALSFVMESDCDDIATAAGVATGERHSRLLQLVGSFLARDGCDVAIFNLAIEWNKRCQPPLDEAEVYRQVNNILQKEQAKRNGHTSTNTSKAAQVVGGSTQIVVDQFRPFPCQSLPEPIRSFVVAGAKAIGCDESYIALPMLSNVAAAIGNTRRLRLKRGWDVAAIIWTAIVGESGTSKTPAFQLVLKHVRRRQRISLERYFKELERHKSETAIFDKLMSNWKKQRNSDELPPMEPEAPVAERYVVSDTTIEALAPILLENPRGLLLARDELSGWIGGFDKYSSGKSDESHWLSTYNGESFIIDRKTGQPKTIFVPDACVSITGGIQPRILHRVLGQEHRESGLAARILMACPPRRAKRWTEANINSGLESDVSSMIDELYNLQPVTDAEGKPCPGYVTLTADAKSVWTTYYDSHATEQVDLDGDIAAAWSKLEEAAARIALIVHFVRWAAGDVSNPDKLDSTSMNSGIAIATWFKSETRRIYRIFSESESESNYRRLVEWIERRDGSVTARDVQRGCRWIASSSDATSALNGLVSAGVGEWFDSPATSKGGRPTRVFRLVRRSLVDTTSVDETSEQLADPEVVSTVDSVDTTAAQSTSIGSVDVDASTRGTITI